ncbi:MAG TPA: LptE family protein [Nitrospirota bacterium]|nr:LptE family protein [Nitrospirota bacterium]
MIKRGNSILAWLVAGLLAVSCGYRLTPVGGLVPQDAKTIAIPVFINSTFEPYIDVEATKAVVDEFLADGRLAVADLESADLILRGSITKFELTPASFTSDYYVSSYNVTISVKISLEDRRTGKFLLKDAGLGTVFIQSYSVTPSNISQTKILKGTAVISACKDLATSIRSRVLEGF